MTELISPRQFMDEPFMSAAEKDSVLKSWVRFLKGGCAWHDFTTALYEHLTLHCCFIAHYSRSGFYEHYFSSPSQHTLRFLNQFDPAKPGISAEIGMLVWLNGPTAADLNRAMRDAAAPYVARLREQFSFEKKRSELALATALARAHGFALMEQADLPQPAILEPELKSPASELPTQQVLFSE
ncbi:MAG TPA: hypothetical protein VFR24_04590 [Candidatus Angelobacter sp.]|nr:hypothetical protein [Candidatus Angelobacter sp.]